jgi:hypothetical protein
MHFIFKGRYFQKEIAEKDDMNYATFILYYGKFEKYFRNKAENSMHSRSLINLHHPGFAVTSKSPPLPAHGTHLQPA